MCWRVIIVDADPRVRSAAREEIEGGSGGEFSVIEALGAATAGELLDREGEVHAAVVSADLGPVQSGLELLRHFETTRPSCARVVLSAVADPCERQRLAELLDGPVVAKPWLPGDLLAALRAARASAGLARGSAPVDPAAKRTWPQLNRAVPADGWPADSLFARGEIVSDTYRIVARLGAGGLAQVYEAHDLPVQRVVALKAPRPGVDGGSIRTEAQAMAAVRHPCVPTVYMVGRHRGIEYLAMERIVGMTLHDHIQQRMRAGQRFTIGETLDILGALSEGLRATHNAGISHRDVLTSNAMLAPGNRVVLLDLGIFRSETALPDDKVAGTPKYMAPEVVTGKVSRGGGHLVDAYALGVVGWELLTGDVPFAGPLMAVLEQHMHAPLPDLRALRADVPEGLHALIYDLLAKDPAARPQTMDQVAATLRALRTEPQRTIPRAHAADRSRPIDVLVVDNDCVPATCVLCTQVARSLPSATLRSAGDAETGLRLLRERVPDLLIVELGLRGMTGLELVMYLRGTHLADRCAIIATGESATPDDVRLASQLGVRFLGRSVNLGARLGTVLRQLFGAQRTAPA